jgi:hypothetical protein
MRIIKNRLLERPVIELRVVDQSILVRSKAGELERCLVQIDTEIEDNRRKHSVLVRQRLAGTIVQSVLDEHVAAFRAHLRDVRTRRGRIAQDLYDATMHSA